MATGAVWTPVDYDVAWGPADAVLGFQANYRGTDPAIREPSPSVTISLAPIFEADGARFAAGEQVVNAAVLKALVDVIAPGDQLTVLDWQHPAYLYSPHLHALTPDEPWLVSPFPNGDYYFFLAPDLSFGTFGHPWQQSLCVFGTALIEALVPTLGATLPVLRQRTA